MANRRLNQFTFSSVPAPVHIYCQVNIGAAGAPTLVQTGGYVLSVSRASAGDYVITLVDQYNKLLGLNASILAASGPTAPDVSIKAQSVASAKTIEIVCRNNSGTATDPASGEQLFLQIMCQNSTAQ